MPRLNLVIADNDEYYVENLGKFIRHGYSSGFNVNVFSEYKSLKEFLEINNGRIDLALAGRLFYPLLAEAGGLKVRVLLSDGRPHGIQDITYEVNRFQRGERIVAEIADIYASVYGSCGDIFRGSRQTTVITAFSPQGGSGKTTLAYSIAAELCSKGKKVLYLNLEYFGYAPFISEVLNGVSLSGVILHLKGSSCSLSARISSAAGTAGQTIASVYPADCPIELDELGEEEAMNLIRLLKEAGHFDAVIIDIPSVLSKMAAAFLKTSDIIVLITEQNVFAAGKLQIYKDAVNRIMPEDAGDIAEKTILVFNKCINLQINHDDTEVSEKRFFIPYAEDVFLKKENRYSINPASKAYPYIEQIAGYLARLVTEVQRGAARANHCTA